MVKFQTFFILGGNNVTSRDFLFYYIVASVCTYDTYQAMLRLFYTTFTKFVTSVQTTEEFFFVFYVNNFSS